ncbi:MAG: acyltransferase, partial [Sphingobacteriaceae bacterium]
MNPADHLKFRYDINALRAIAVTGVLLFHFKVPYFSGGFSGVDVFFVISGYLMTKIIMNDINSDNFSVLAFYGKRLRRIVPALLFLILILTVVCFFLYFPHDYQSIEKNCVSSVLFISNIIYWQTAGYFDRNSEANVLLHTWSLSVEWQFYMIYPLILLLLNKFLKSKMHYLTVFIGATFLLYAGAVYAARIHTEGAFFLLPTRCWEMALGGVAFFSDGLLKSKLTRKYLAVAGYLLIGLSFLTLNNKMAWPGEFTMMPLFATYLVIAANYNNVSLLKSGVVQWIGKISYSLYLWHWPVYVIAIYIGIHLNV